ncbi:AI-2E family transporter [Fulvivirgaceae bacterium BMA10]|uniref:AI-2E family transporter n=1 Tax=Splendidivirga corallicola TaxID=3051826 RepID=A0ABT8L079_9BACT|nr:AI-2E family transporter [Fulvivirgaceae bacterium BMA10]
MLPIAINDRILKGLLYLIVVGAILHFGQALFIPLSFAILISFILYPFCKWLERHKVPFVLAIFIGLVLFSFILLIILGLLIRQLVLFTQKWPQLQEKLMISVDDLNVTLKEWGFHFMDEEKGVIGNILYYISNDVIPRIPDALYSSSISMVLFIIIPVYVVLILIYKDLLVKFLYEVTPKSWNIHIKKILPDVIITYYNFIKGMAIVYLIVGILNSIGLLILGIPHAIFFGFIASILTFVPYVGITIGALLPIAVAWLTYDSIWYPVGIIIVFVVVQVLEANVIFPVAVSNRLKINALVTLVVIIAGGIVWGAAGMILFLPFTAIIKLIADQIPELKSLSILLGTNDDLHKFEREEKKIGA